MSLLALALLAAAAHPAPARLSAAGLQTAGQDWSRTVTRSSVGAFVIGNPAARVKVIEFGSYTCSHCAHFSQTVVPQLIASYVRGGQASYEFRNAVRDRYDLVAAVLARCAGPRDFFPATAKLYASQQDWVDQAINYEGAHADELGKLDGAEKGMAIARAAGLDTLFAARGVPPQRQRACLADQADLDRISAMSQDAFDTLGVPGTPAVYVNGTLMPGVPDWPKLEAAIIAALKK